VRQAPQDLFLTAVAGAAKAERVLPNSLRQLLPPIAAQRPVTGGDINQAFCLELDSGERLFAKTHASPPPQMFEAEALGLASLDQALPGFCPEVIAVSADGLVLEWLDLAPGSCGAASGRALAELHQQPTKQFGGQDPNYLGIIEQRQPACQTWAELYGQHRLAPLASRLPSALAKPLDRLIPRLEKLLDLPDPPSLIHGDLWGGNAGETAQGRAVIYDPAVATAHREQDLAMSLLFGGFSPAFYAAYEEHYPLTPGWRERVPLHQLYPLLVHVLLFGSGYASQAHSAMSRYL